MIEEFQTALELQLEGMIQDFNSNNGTDYTVENIPNELVLYVALFLEMSIYGWQDSYKDRYSKETLDILKAQFGDDLENYKGIENTTEQEKENLFKRIEKEILNTESQIGEKLTPEQKQLIANSLEQEFVRDRKETILNGITGAVIVGSTILASDSGLNFAGAISRRDNRVRPTHILNDNRYWDVKRQKPWHDFNCRCTYFFFKNEKEAEANGYKPRF